MQNKGESGRSMIEILGMLAVMGLLGMAGVKMYTNAMNKHRANELIYEAQKRATMVAMQITAGQGGLSVAGFKDPTGYTFGVEQNSANTNQFNITITGVDSAICTQMKTTVGPATPIRVISEFCDRLTFNNDLSTTSYASDFNGNQEECEKKNDQKYCLSDNTCIPSTSECACSRYDVNECGQDMYCSFKASGNGTCRPLPAEAGTITLNLGEEGTKTLYNYGDGNWWTAMNICLGAQKELAGLSDFGIENEGECSGVNCEMNCNCGKNNRTCTDNSVASCENGICNCWKYLKNKIGYSWTKNLASITGSALVVAPYESKVPRYSFSGYYAYVGTLKILCK